MTPSYPVQSVTDFGRDLIRTGDLDPVYIALQRLNLGADQQARLLLGYWCTYHLGVASILSEAQGADFWTKLREVAVNEGGCPATADGRWPRNKERRHWRAKNATLSAIDLQAKFKQPEHTLSFLRYGHAEKGSAPPDVGVTGIMARTQTLVGFGPWIAFKIADMIDALGLAELDFSRAAVFMFDNPKEAALTVWRRAHGFGETVQPKDKGAVINGVVDHLLVEFSDLKCPHNKTRGIRVQEVETVLCKWSSHLSGHYGPLNDIHEAMEGLAGWGKHSEIADALYTEFEGMDGAE